MWLCKARIGLSSPIYFEEGHKSIEQHRSIRSKVGTRLHMPISTYDLGARKMLKPKSHKLWTCHDNVSVTARHLCRSTPYRHSLTAQYANLRHKFVMPTKVHYSSQTSRGFT